MAAIELSIRPFSSAGIVISLLIAGSLFSLTAHASCGDYVHSRRSLILNQHSFDDADDVRRGDSGRRMLDVPRLPSPIPCSAPGCGKSTLPVSTPPVVPFQVIRLNDGLMVSRLMTSLEPPMSFPGFFSSDGQAQEGFPLLIEVPPETNR